MTDDKRYITDLKQIPEGEVNNKVKKVQNKPLEKENKKEKEAPVKENLAKKIDERERPVVENAQGNEKIRPSQSMRKNKHTTLNVKKSGNSNLPFSTRDVVLGVLNIFLVGAILFLLFDLPQKAEKLKDIKNQNIRNEEIASLKISDVNLQKDKIEALENSFLDESGVLDFVREIEVLKEDGTVKDLSFESQEAVKDRTNNFVLPIEITLVGQREEIKEDVQKIESLPYLFRVVKIDLQEYVPGEDEEKVESGLLQMDLGGVIYVDEKLGENR